MFLKICVVCKGVLTTPIGEDQLSQLASMFLKICVVCKGVLTPPILKILLESAF